MTTIYNAKIDSKTIADLTVSRSLKGIVSIALPQTRIGDNEPIQAEVDEKGVRLEFAQFGHFDSFEVIRSTTSMESIADNELPAPIATGLKTMYYVDESVIEGATYFYKIRVKRGVLSFVSEEVSIIALQGDKYFQYVELLFLTDGVVKDYSNHKRTPVVTGTYAFVPSTTIPLKYDDYSYDISDYGALDFGSITLGIDDFTLETYVYSPPNSYIGTLFTLLNATSFRFAASRSGFIGITGPVYAEFPFSMTWNTWNHWCLMRKNGVFYLYLNGVLCGQLNSSYSLLPSTIRIFADSSRNETLRSDYMSSTRLTRFARYTHTGFTPPTEKFKTM
ncbi:MAG: hypothetical protein RR677_03620 [Acinetobacter sp.]